VTPSYYCEYCGAHIVRREAALCLSRHRIFRRAVRWTAEVETFTTGDHEVMFHEACFVEHAPKILGALLEGIQISKPRKWAINPPQWD